MAASRKSTPRRARSSSVASDTSAVSTRSGAGASKPASKSKTNTPKKEKKAPATPRRSKAKASSEAESSQDTPSAAAAATPTKASAKKPTSAAKPRSSTKPASAGKSSAAATPKTPGSAAKPRKSTSSSLTPAQKKAVAARPALPKERNTVLPEAQPPVKLQVINREGANIIIGRVKLPTTIHPRHGFLLRRFDTNAIAASAMYRLAFPHASQEEEASEMEYIEKRYDTNVANGGMERVQKKPRGRPSKKALEAAAAGEEIPFEEVLPAGSTGVRLQGTWIPCGDALELAREYGLDAYAVPLIEADAEQGEDGAPILTPSKNDVVSTPGAGGRAAAAYDESPTKQRTAKRARDEAAGAASETSAAEGGLTASEIEKQIQESQALAKGIQGSGKTTTPTASRKRRATHQSPSAHNNALSEDEDYEHSNTVVRSIRRGTRAARRRPIATTAGALGAAGAVGAGALAYMSGGNLDVATQLLTQSFQSLSQWFFY